MGSSAPLRLRPTLEPVAVRDQEGRELLLLRDHEALMEDAVALAWPVGIALLGVLDGTRDRAALLAAWRGRLGEGASLEALGRLLDELDAALVLEGPRVEAARRAATDAWLARPHRPARHAGTCYPEEPTALRARLGAWRAAAAVETPLAGVRHVIAPHIDPRGGGPCHGAAIEALAACEAEVFVVLGTAHAPLRRRAALTPHDHLTPTGPLRVDGEIVARLAARGGGGLLDDARAHAAEHSVELQAAWIHALHGHRDDVRLVPLLVGSLHEHLQGDTSPTDDPAWVDLAAALRELVDEQPGRVALVASIDLAHVGPAYGDAEAPDETALERVLAADRSLLEGAERLDPAAWLGALQAEQDAYHVCGAAPAWLFLKALQGTDLVGRRLRHDVWEIDAETGSHVSFAAVAYTDAPETTDA